MKKIAVTGHRPDKLGGYSLNNPFKIAISEHMVHYINRYSPDLIITGMALGVDTWWALAGILTKTPILAAVPFEGQEKMWPKESQDLYNKILNAAMVTKVVVSSGGYLAKKMQIRNEYMVNEATEVLAYWDGSPGGTANCVRYAKSINKPITIINPNSLK